MSDADDINSPREVPSKTKNNHSDAVNRVKLRGNCHASHSMTRQPQKTSMPSAIVR
jgi:hypothetical protein